jgi:hypothetical protein
VPAATVPGSDGEEPSESDDEDARPPRRRRKLSRDGGGAEDGFALTLEVVDESTVADCALQTHTQASIVCGLCALSDSFACDSRQLWRGALLLGDWLLHCDVPPDAMGVELGAGLGLCSILLGRVCRTVFATDMRGPGLLFLKRNVARSLTSGSESDVRVRDLNWSKNWPPEYRAPDRDPDADEWNFRQADAAAVADVSVFLAADVLYDTAATVAFCRLLPQILLPAARPDVPGPENAGRWLWLSLERRIVFSVAEQRAHAPAVELFFDLLREDGRLVAMQIPIDTIPQRIEYERTPQLELWRVEARSMCIQG